jgi:ferritin-like metal-binding protein YciE
MAAGKTLNERDAKLVSWLGEAHGKEAELEADLTAHIALTQKPAYKKRLQQHLKETRDHKRRVASRIKQLGGPTGQNLISATGSAVGEVAGKTVAAVKGQVGAARAIVTQQAETHLRNAQEEFREEHVEIALYTRIEAFATAVGDRETAQLAKSIRRDEERMAKFLLAEIGRLVKDVVRADIPRDQRPSARRRTRASRSTSRARSRTSSSRASASASRSRSTSARSTSRSSGSSRSGSTRSGSTRSSSTRSSSSRSGSTRSGSTRSSSRSGGSSRTRARASARS